MIYTSKSIEETSSIAGRIIEDLTNTHDHAVATVVCLSGHLGAGKTALVKAIANHLGVNEEITSPTFVIMKIYPLSAGKWKNLVHIDAYRLDGGNDLAMLGFEKITADPGNIVFIEWSERVQDIVPITARHIRCEDVAGNKRFEV